jgi:hypothetical protein
MIMPSGSVSNIQSIRWPITAPLLAIGAVLSTSTSSLAAETRGYVLSWFYPSSYSQEGDCPKGLNPSVEDNFKRILKSMGKTPDEIAQITKNSNGAMMGIMPKRGKIGGTPVNVYVNPASVPDPQAHTVEGNKSYGFNLDGKNGPKDFVDPETGEKGVDNAVFRALGCFTPHRATPPDRPSYAAGEWDMVRDAMPAFLIEISGIDSDVNDENVEVGIYQALEPIVRNAYSGNPERDRTFRADPSARVQNVTRGSIKNGILSVEPFDVNLIFDHMWIPEFHFRGAKLRLKLGADGSLNGVMGAYHEWKPIYWGTAITGVFGETVISYDMPSVYYALKKTADAVPDPKTGENTMISGTWGIEAVPAFIVHESKVDRTAGVVAPSRDPKRQ